MDTARYVLRPFVDADYPAAARIDASNDPGHGHSAEELRIWDRSEVTDARVFRRKVVAEDRSTGTAVAVGSLAHSAWAFDPERYGIGVDVEATAQGRGIGRAVYADLEGTARARGARWLSAWVRADHDRAVRFFQRLGYVTRRARWTSRLDVTAARLDVLPDRSAALAAEGVHVTTARAEGERHPEVRQRIYELVAAASVDEPRLGQYTPVSFEQFARLDLDNESVLPDAIFLAVQGDRYVGFSSLYRDLERPDVLNIGFTGVLREVRGRGVASLLKRRAVEYARAAGIRSLRTNNDSENAPIWSINERLGFQKETTWLLGEKELPSEGPRG